MMIPVPRAGVLKEVEGLDEAKRIGNIDDVIITAHVTQQIAPPPEGASYLGFIFSRAASPDEVEAALREAHSRLRFIIEPADCLRADFKLAAVLIRSRIQKRMEHTDPEILKILGARGKFVMKYDTNPVAIKRGHDREHLPGPGRRGAGQPGPRAADVHAHGYPDPDARPDAERRTRARTNPTTTNRRRRRTRRRPGSHATPDPTPTPNPTPLRRRIRRPRRLRPRIRRRRRRQPNAKPDPTPTPTPTPTTDPK